MIRSNASPRASKPNARQPRQPRQPNSRAGSRDLCGNENYLKCYASPWWCSPLQRRECRSGPRARGPSRLSLVRCNKPWKGCPEEGGSRLGEKFAGFSEAMAMYDDDGASTSALDRRERPRPRCLKGLGDERRRDVARHGAGSTVPFDHEQPRRCSRPRTRPRAASTKKPKPRPRTRPRAVSWLFKFLAILLELVLGLFVFGRVIPRRSSSAKGAAWRSYVVGYLLIWPEIALVAAAATSVRGSDYAITKRSKIKTNESPSSSVQKP